MKKTFTVYYVAITDIHTKKVLSLTGPFETVTDAQNDRIWLTYNYPETLVQLVTVQS